MTSVWTTLYFHLDGWAERAMTTASDYLPAVKKPLGGRADKRF